MKLKKFFSSNIREISLIIVMIALSVFIEIRSGGNFFTLENISDMFTETAVLAITAVGMMMVIITSGIDLSIGSIMALGAMVGGTILKNNQAVPGVVIILVSIAVGIVCGFINGTLVAKLKILPIYCNTRYDEYISRTYIFSCQRKLGKTTGNGNKISVNRDRKVSWYK